MATELTIESLGEDAAAPANMAVDGQSVGEHSLPDKIEVIKFKANNDALAGTNASGGPKSAWGRTRAALAVPPGGGP